MKERQGEAFEPARLAIVQYALAQDVADDPSCWIDLEGMVGVLDQFDESTSEENKRLRALISEIADMDLGEPEVEHRTIIDRCRSEIEEWDATETAA